MVRQCYLSTAGPCGSYASSIVISHVLETFNTRLFFTHQPILTRFEVDLRSLEFTAYSGHIVLYKYDLDIGIHTLTASERGCPR